LGALRQSFLNLLHGRDDHRADRPAHRSCCRTRCGCWQGTAGQIHRAGNSADIGGASVSGGSGAGVVGHAMTDDKLRECFRDCCQCERQHYRELQVKDKKISELQAKPNNLYYRLLKALKCLREVRHVS